MTVIVITPVASAAPGVAPDAVTIPLASNPVAGSKTTTVSFTEITLLTSSNSARVKSNYRWMLPAQR